MVLVKSFPLRLDQFIWTFGFKLAEFANIIKDTHCLGLAKKDVMWNIIKTEIIQQFNSVGLG